MKDQLEAVVTSLKNILQTCHVTSVLDTPIFSFQDALQLEGAWRTLTIKDARAELLDCIHIEEDNDNTDTAERLRDVLRSIEGCAGCRMCPSCNGCKSQRIV